MAKIEIVKEATEYEPRSVEALEVVVWGAGGTASQEFLIGSGGNLDASTNFWLEIRYSVQGLPVYYTRNAFSHAWGDVCSGQLEDLEKFERDEDRQAFGFGDMLPETSLSLLRKKYTYPGANGKEETSASYILKISADLGAVFGHSSPGNRMLELCLTDIELEAGLSFMRELILELEAACQDRHPDPGQFPPGFSDWPFARELNRRAYDQVSVDYQENYFAEPLLNEAFEGWLAQLPPGGQILDAGCGHGDPVIARLLERGFRPVGSDLSPAMLARARQQFPGVEFWERAVTEIETEAAFEGICSFSSLLYLDQVEFFHGLYRLHRALKPGGLLFLYGYNLHPTWRGEPYGVTLGQWMWGGTRGISETSRALEQHGYFKVLQALETTPEAERQEKIAQWRLKKQKEYDEWLQSLPPTADYEPRDYSNVTPTLPHPYLILAQKQTR
jgi:SAM-dependent methyltransferase